MKTAENELSLKANVSPGRTYHEKRMMGKMCCCMMCLWDEVSLY